MEGRRDGGRAAIMNETDERKNIVQVSSKWNDRGGVKRER